ncbi:MAG: YggS family pyridoxal phosphate-dependent enzyme [Gammaproteobacteria bacterium]|nr:YggS family pyridoxal phosphate-dependent enzyme [Gammaproteobacteria bacterium]
MHLDLKQRFDSIRQRVWCAEMAAGRQPGKTKIVAVSKTQSADAIRHLYELGQRDFAESYLQEALPKMEVLRDLDITWHYIGRIQTNKTRDIATHFDWIQSVDREKVGRRLSEQRPEGLPDLNICIQVNISHEAGKAGVTPEGVQELASSLSGMDHLVVRGLMAIPERDSHEGGTSTSHSDLHKIYRALQQQGFKLDTLSMGMSDDLEVAIENGATAVRIGTALFGARN